MVVLAFQKPDKVIMIESDDYRGKFEFRPLEPGYGITVGNALRRILLSSLEGYAITAVKIEGVEHEFSTITGDAAFGWIPPSWIKSMAKALPSAATQPWSDNSNVSISI